MKYLFIIALGALSLASCTKVISVDLNSSDPKIVIEGNISNEPGPYFVRISETVNFSAANTYPAVSGAMVVINDNAGTIDTLTESISGLYQTSKIVGTPGRTYNMSVVARGKSYYATSTMPVLVKLDSLRFNVFATPGSKDPIYTVIPVFRDPATTGNNYRFVETINGKEVKAYIVFNDDATNGIVNQRPIFGGDEDVKSGDEVSVEMRCIDPATYLYFYTLGRIDGNGPGGGTTPANPPNNITGSPALGIFTAYSTQRVTQKAPL